jgi:hypothetical protein
VTGIVRGDESCGLRLRNASDAGSRLAAGAAFVSDYPEGHLLHRLGLGPQPWPSWMEPLPEESGEAYCDRIDQQYYQSTVLAPLSAIKARYLEIVNPLLSRRVIGVVRELPDDVRMYASVLHEIATRDCGHIPFARFSSTPEAGDYLSDPDMVETTVRWLTSPAMAAVLSDEAATVLLAAVATPGRERSTAKSRVRSALKALRVVLPKEMGERLTPRFVGPDPVSPRGVALRAVIAAKAIALLQADAGILRSSG